eukprot:SAG11_NODE_25546_length_357_cov_0.996124_1_plen_59_part_01
MAARDIATAECARKYKNDSNGRTMWAGARADAEFKAAKGATSAKARFDPEMRSLGKTDL